MMFAHNHDEVIGLEQSLILINWLRYSDDEAMVVDNQDWLVLYVVFDDRE